MIDSNNQEEDNKDEQSQQNPLAGTQNPLAQNPQNAKPDQQSNAGTQSLTSGTSSNINTAPTAANPAADQSKRSSGRFTNLQNFIKANQGTNLGGKVAGQIENKQKEAEGQLQNEQNTFQTGLNQAKDQSQGVFGQAKQSLNQLNAPKAVASPTDLNQAENSLSSAQNFQYQGPKQLGNQDTLTANQQNLESMGKATDTEAGRFGLLQTLFNKPNYTKGQQRLDQLLLQGDPNAVNQLNAVKQKALGFGSELSAANTQANQAVSDLTSNIGQQQSDIGNQIGLSYQGLTGQLQSAADKARDAETMRAQAASKELGGRDPNQVVNQVTLPSGQIVPITLSQLLSRGGGSYQASDPTMANIDPNKAAIANIFARLSGQNQLQVSDDPNGAYKAGTYGINQNAANDLSAKAKQYGIDAASGKVNDPWIKDYANSLGMTTDPYAYQQKIAQEATNRYLNNQLGTPVTTPGVNKGAVGR